MTGAAAESHCSIGPHADMGTHRTDAIHTHTAAERSEMVKEPVSTPDARWVQAQLGVKLLTRTETVGSPISNERLCCPSVLLTAKLS